MTFVRLPATRKHRDHIDNMHPWVNLAYERERIRGAYTPGEFDRIHLALLDAEKHGTPLWLAYARNKSRRLHRVERSA